MSAVEYKYGMKIKILVLIFSALGIIQGVWCYSAVVRSYLCIGQLTAVFPTFFAATMLMCGGVYLAQAFYKTLSLRLMVEEQKIHLKSMGKERYFEISDISKIIPLRKNGLCVFLADGTKFIILKDISNYQILSAKMHATAHQHQ